MPTPYRILFSKRAGSDLKAIFERIARDSPQNAANFVARVLDTIATLKLFPHRAIVQAQHPDLKHPVRSLSVRPYIVVFRVVEKHRIVRILQVRHGARRRPDRFE